VKPITTQKAFTQLFASRTRRRRFLMLSKIQRFIQRSTKDKVRISNREMNKKNLLILGLLNVMDQTSTKMASTESRGHQGILFRSMALTLKSKYSGTTGWIVATMVQRKLRNITPNMILEEM
jgi:hypothetical protein